VGASIEELDLDVPVGNGAPLADELVQPRLNDSPIAIVINVEPMRIARRLAVDSYAEPSRRPSGRWPQHQVHIAGVAAVPDAAVRGVQYGSLLLQGPLADERPLVEP
jgi:hypothetical protein